MHSRFRAGFLAAAVGILAVDVRPARSDDPQKKVSGSAGVATVQQGRKAIDKAVGFLEKDAAKWRSDRGCATCHHGTMSLWALSEARSQGYAVNAQALADIVQWMKDRFGKVATAQRDPRPGWSLVSVPTIYLGMMSQNLPILSRDELNRVAVHLAAHQEEDGAWEQPPPKNGAPPTWESRETIALMALLAWEPTVPSDPKQAAALRASRDKTVAWLSKTKSTDTTQALALRLLLDVRVGKETPQLQPAIDQLLKRQITDGGWSQVKELGSDAYATGQVLYVLSFAGVRHDRPEIQRAISFLASTQRDDGAWPMTSRNHPGVESTRKPIRNPVPITYFGSAWATLGLVRSVPSAPDTLAKRQRAFDEIQAYHGKYEQEGSGPDRPVVSVDLRYYEMDDQVVAKFAELLQAFPQLATLQFKSKKITDAGLTHLKSLPGLRNLTLEEAPITDAGLAHLKALTQLQELHLKGTKVTDAGIIDFRKALPKVTVHR